VSLTDRFRPATGGEDVSDARDVGDARDVAGVPGHVGLAEERAA
jgi:hypothetical protein